MGVGRTGKPRLTPPRPVSAQRAAKSSFPPPGPPTRPRGSALAPGSPASRGPLERLRCGEIDLDSYLDLKVDGATAHLKGLPPSELAKVRAVLREQIAQDPAIANLVWQATGRLPRTE